MVRKGYLLKGIFKSDILFCFLYTTQNLWKNVYIIFFVSIAPWRESKGVIITMVGINWVSPICLAWINLLHPHNNPIRQVVFLSHPFCRQGIRGSPRWNNFSKTSPKSSVAGPEYRLRQSDSHAFDFNLCEIRKKSFWKTEDFWDIYLSE